MRRRPLRELLAASLPAAEPSAEFTARVMERVGDERGRRRRWRRRLVAAGVILVLAAGWGGWEWNERRHERHRREALVELKRDSAALRREIATIRQRLSEDHGVVYLGGSERIDVVLDLAALADDSTQESSDVPLSDNT